MSVTKEQVVAEAEKLGLTLDESQVNAYITIGLLPAKVEGSPPDKKSDDDDLPEGVKKRMSKLAEQKNEFKKQAEETAKKLQEIEAKLSEKDTKDKADKGEWEKLTQEANELKSAAQATIEASKGIIKTNSIKSIVELELIKAGCITDRLPSALKLMDLDDIGFEWIDETNLKYDINTDKVSRTVAEFKKQNDFLFATEDGKLPYKGNQPNSPTNKKMKEEQIKVLESKFPALGVG